MATVGTRLSTIITAIRNKIVAAGILPLERCRVSLRMNVPNHNQYDQYAVILPLTQPHDQASVAGAGRRSTIVEGRINIYLRHSLATDDGYGDEQWLLNPTDGGDTIPRGFLDTLNLIEDCLDLWEPAKADGSAMLCEPMRAYFANEPRKDYDDPKWGEGMIEVETKYEAYRTNV